MTTIILSIAAGVGAVVILLVVLWALRMARGGSENRIAELVTEMNTRMETMVRELTEALERAQEEGRRNRVLGELAGSIDLDEVLTRTLEAAGAIPGADAALVTISDGNDKPLVATLGLSAEEAQRQAITGPPDGHEARSIVMSYQYPPEIVSGTASSQLIHSGLAVPVPGEGGPIGYLAVFSRGETNAFGEDAVKELEELAVRAGPAIENAKRFREARQLADLDALTGLHNRRYFHETLAREVARGHRYDRRLALIVFDLDDFKAINDRIGHLSGDAVLAEAAERVRDVVRSADIACRVGGDEFAVVLPESTLKDADQLYRRLQGAISAKSVGQAGRLSLSAGIAELKPEDDSTSFFERADEALYRAKEKGKAQVVAADAATG
ncbi:MAG: sensor domain-containing diguanylate cyclase [Actinomycetota bacterium]|nr:sensor domain-containing diguanylate cyclase [Actinomycetota bacterium]